MIPACECPPAPGEMVVPPVAPDGVDVTVTVRGEVEEPESEPDPVSETESGCAPAPAVVGVVGKDVLLGESDPALLDDEGEE